METQPAPACLGATIAYFSHTESMMEWIFGKTPPPDAPGWYAVLLCYDTEEGVLPGSAEWDGAAWKHKAVVAFGERRDTEREADDLAYDNDPDIPREGRA